MCPPRDIIPGVGDVTSGLADLVGGLVLKLAPGFWVLLGAAFIYAHLIMLAVICGGLAAATALVFGGAILITRRLERSRATLVSSTPSFTLRLAAQYHPELAAPRKALPAARKALPAGQPRPMPRGLAITGARTLTGRTIRPHGGK